MVPCLIKLLQEQQKHKRFTPSLKVQIRGMAWVSGRAHPGPGPSDQPSLLCQIRPVNSLRAVDMAEIMVVLYEFYKVHSDAKNLEIVIVDYSICFWWFSFSAIPGQGVLTFDKGAIRYDAEVWSVVKIS